MEEQHIRPSWDDYFLNLADTVSERATCNRGRSGCVIVKDKQILVTGYVGSPKGLPTATKSDICSARPFTKTGPSPSTACAPFMPSRTPFVRLHVVASLWMAALCIAA